VLVAGHDEERRVPIRLCLPTQYPGVACVYIAGRGHDEKGNAQRADCAGSVDDSEVDGTGEADDPVHLRPHDPRGGEYRRPTEARTDQDNALRSVAA
jgi:hypothetical protein